MKMLRNLSVKLGGKFPSTSTLGSVVRIALLNDAFLGILELEASPKKDNHSSKKIGKGEKGKPTCKL